LFTAVLPAQQSFERSLSIHSGAVHLGLNGIELPDSSLLAVGVFSDSAQNQRVCLVWTNSTGDTTHTRIVQTNAVREIASKAIRHSSGDLYVAGRTDDTSNSDALLMKLDANGGVQWRHSNGTGSFNERYTTVCSSIDGNFIAGGRSVNLQTNAYYLKSEAVQLSGTSLWSKEWRTRLGEINDVAQAPDSSIYFTGYVLDFGDTSGAMFLMKTNSQGDSLWTKKYFGQGWATGNSLLILPDGILLAGASAASALFAGDHYLVRTNFSGDTLWTRRIGSVNADEKTMDVSFTSDNCYILCGNSRSSLELVKVDTLGNVEWTHDYNSGDASGNSVVETLDSGYFAVGSSSLSTGLPLIYLVKTDATGGILLGETLPEQLTNEIRFYPNPSDGRVYFMPAELRNITVTDFSGKIVYRCEQCSGSLDLSPLSAGAYFLFARSEKGDFMQGKILLTAAH
ncbi:MAG TPA: hypothetical protein PLU53_08215, partial [Bacteroidia bacterium]|nr:hypothetical protein [Bacteroidia bacterium]